MTFKKPYKTMIILSNYSDMDCGSNRPGRGWLEFCAHFLDGWVIAASSLLTIRGSFRRAPA
jgi:hypothetical protein